MARTKTWWTRRTAGSNIDPPASFNLLFGSAAAFQGSTLLRIIGRVDVSFAVSSTTTVIRTIFGIVVTATPDPAILLANTTEPFLWFVQFIPSPRPSAVGDFTGTLGFDTLTSWDVEVPRVLGVGESIWLLYESNIVDPAGSNWLAVSNRALFLDPPV